MQLSEIKNDIDQLAAIAYDKNIDQALSKVNLGDVPHKYYKYINSYINTETYTFADVIGDYLFENYYLSRDIKL